MHSVVCNKQNSCFLINTDDIDGSYDCNGFLIVIVLHGYILNPNSSRMFWTYSNNYCCYKTGHKNKQTNKNTPPALWNINKRLRFRLIMTCRVFYRDLLFEIQYRHLLRGSSWPHQNLQRGHEICTVCEGYIWSWLCCCPRLLNFILYTSLWINRHPVD